ncbi:hypothetical protein [Herbidospora sp. RD11066]
MTYQVPVDVADDGPVDELLGDLADASLYRIEWPGVDGRPGGYVMARIGGEADPVPIAIEHPGLQARLTLPREVAWGIASVLTDGLITSPDAIPEWALTPAIPRDDDGTPYPGMPAFPDLPT